VELKIAKVHHLLKRRKVIKERTYWLSRDLVMKVPIYYYLFKVIEIIGDTGPFGFRIKGFKPIARLWSESEH
jgi:hypothetical protein